MWAVAAAVTIGWVLWMALRPGHAADTLNLTPLHEPVRAVRCLLSDCSTAASAARLLFINGLGNVAVFVPIGFSLTGAVGHRRPGVAIALGAALSIGIELAQLGIPGRATDVDDVLFNTTGTALGAACLAVIQHRKPSRKPCPERNEGSAFGKVERLGNNGD